MKIRTVPRKLSCCAHFPLDGSRLSVDYGGVIFLCELIQDEVSTVTKLLNRLDAKRFNNGFHVIKL